MASWWHRLIFIWNLLILGASFSVKSWVMLLVWKVIDINLWIWDIKYFPLDDLKSIFKAIPRGLCSLRYIVLEDTGAGQVLNCPDVQKGRSFQVCFFFLNLRNYYVSIYIFWKRQLDQCLNFYYKASLFLLLLFFHCIWAYEGS